MTIFTNIHQLVGVSKSPKKVLRGQELSHLEYIENAYLMVKDGCFESYGSMDQLNLTDQTVVVDLQGKSVFPSFCDSHSHIVYAGSREQDFLARIKGFSYEDIAKQGGGILNSALKLQEISENELFESALRRLNEVILMGTSALEIKSGYGLSVEGELKMLRVIQRLKNISPIEIKATFLGAHAVPLKYKDNRKTYIELICNMLPQISDEKLADYIDVFCDQGFFTIEETDLILNQASKYGLKPKIHANELGYTGGVQVGTKYGAISVDHLEYMGEEEIKAIQNSDTIATLLPSTAFFLNFNYPNARKLISADLPVALASDFNPGSSPSGNMNFVLSLACTQMKMTPEEAINAATLNGAAAIELSKTHGSISPGKQAHFFVTEKIPHYAYLPYYFGKPLVDQVYIKGLKHESLIKD